MNYVLSWEKSGKRSSSYFGRIATFERVSFESSHKSAFMEWSHVLLCCFSYQAFAQCDFTEVNIQTSTGEWGDEMSWDLYQNLDNGEALLIASFQGEFDQMTTNDQLCLEDGCYFFSLSDSWGD